LVVWYLGSRGSWISGFLAGSFLLNIHAYRFWSTTQYADIPLCFFFTAAVILLVCALRYREDHLFLLSGLLTGISTWTKNEGLFFTTWILFILVCILTRNQTRTPNQKWKPLFFFVFGLVVALSATTFAKMALGLQGGEYLGSGRSLNDYITALFNNVLKTQFIASSFLVFKMNYEQWNGLWILFFLTLFFCGKQGYQNYRWVFPMIIFLTEIGYFIVLHWAPDEIKHQISVSLLRLMMHIAAIAIIYSFESLGCLGFKRQEENMLEEKVT